MTWWMTAKPGDNVVCVKIGWTHRYKVGPSITPVVGEIYTIKEIYLNNGYIYLQFGEIAAVCKETGKPWMWIANHFEPVVKSDMDKKVNKGMDLLHDIEKGGYIRHQGGGWDYTWKKVKSK